MNSVIMIFWNEGAFLKLLILYFLQGFFRICFQPCLSEECAKIFHITIEESLCIRIVQGSCLGKINEDWMLIEIQDIESGKVGMDQSCMIKPAHAFDNLVKEFLKFPWPLVFQLGGVFFLPYKLKHKYIVFEGQRRRNTDICGPCFHKIPVFALHPCKDDFS